ncbi:glycosyltransferase family 4 protein [Planctomicrobium sp. SH664]|uniref:glycosyltransferase family 4 protein n=1 Tax=Planctomicrobium sp. SH664 TaxID=3448125 RepID=UPI003F5B7FAA
MHIAILTAGRAGTFCGSCLHDHSWSRALRAEGLRVTLVPTFAPLQLDEPDGSERRVFLGGVNVALASRWAAWNRLPRAVTAPLDSRSVIRWFAPDLLQARTPQAAQRAIDLLEGEGGTHREAIRVLAEFVSQQLRPDVVISTHLLLGGVMRAIQSRWSAPQLCLLQGGEQFLDEMSEPLRSRALSLVRDQVSTLAGNLVHSDFYRQQVSRTLSISADRISLIAPGVDMERHTGRPSVTRNERLTIGYFGQICPHKGFVQLVDALVLLKPQQPDFLFRFGGVRTKEHRQAIDAAVQKLRAANIDFEDIGSPSTVAEKSALLQSLDLVSLLTEIPEVKGLPVLESLANGTPVVLPDHGIFPEMIAKTGGGLLVPSGDVVALAAAFQQLADPIVRLRSAEQGWRGVRQHHSLRQIARTTLEVIRDLLPISCAPSG